MATMDDLDFTTKNALTGCLSPDWKQQQAVARESATQSFISKQHLHSIDELKQALRNKYERAGHIDRGPAFRRTRAACGGQLDLAGWRHFLKLSGIYVSDPPGRDLVKELWTSKRTPATDGGDGVVEFPAFAELCFGNEPIVSDIGRKHGAEQSQMARAKMREQTQNLQADATFEVIKRDPFLELRDKLNMRGKRSYSEKFALLQLLSSYRDVNLKRDGFALALKKIGMKVAPAEVESMFQKCDINRDGEIDYQEFCAVIMGAPSYRAAAVAALGGGLAQAVLTARTKARSTQEAAQRVADTGYHLLRTVPALKELLQREFDKLDSGVSAAASFRRLKRAAGASINAIQFGGLMAFIELHRIPADESLVRQLFDKMVAHSKGVPGKRKTAFSFEDFKREFFAQELTSKVLEEDHAFMDQQRRVRQREKAQELAQKEMADRQGIFLDPNAPVAGGVLTYAPPPEDIGVGGVGGSSSRSASTSPIRRAAVDVISARSVGSNGTGREKGSSSSAGRHNQPQHADFTALPRPKDSKALQRAMSMQVSPQGGALSVRSTRVQSAHSPSGSKELPRNGSKHQTVSQRNRQATMRMLLQKQGINASREELEAIATGGGGGDGGW
jgi:hypothetical protein